MSLWAQASSKAWGRNRSPRSIATLMSDAVDVLFPEGMKWTPLSVRTVWTV